jgi:hypothetical protein
MNWETFTALEQKNFQSRLAALNLNSRMQHSNQKGECWQDAIDHYKMFLSLAHLYPHLTLIPTQKIDRVWHCHLSDPQQYQADCQTLFGYPIEHKVEPQPGDRNRLSAAFALTKTLLTQHFGLTFSDRPDDDPGACMIPARV